jgi:hypothetical protein
MSNTASHRSKFWLYAFLAFVLLACLWAGWRDFDFDPWLSQGEIRENIRSTVRWAIQVLMQLLVPASILYYFGAEAVAAITRR